MMFIEDSHGTDEEVDFTKCLLEYMRIRETNQFDEVICKSASSQNLVISKSNDMKNIDGIEMNKELNDLSDYDIEENGGFEDKSSKNEKNTYKSISIISRLWSDMTECITHHRIHHQTKQVFGDYNKILKFHIERDIYLDAQCFGALLHCTKPKYIESLFNKNLIRDQDQHHISCLFKEKKTFIALDVLSTNESLFNLNPLINSLTIFLYKTKCKENASSILTNLNNRLAVFINQETPYLKRKESWLKFKFCTIKYLLKAMYLNGIFQMHTFKQFLNNIENTLESDLTENDSDDWPSDPESEIENLNLQENVFIHRVDRDHNNNVIETSALKINIGQRIQIDSSKEEITKMFPLSLKNMARLEIKNSMTSYTEKNIKKLDILPKDLRRFCLFQDEINSSLVNLNIH